MASFALTKAAESGRAKRGVWTATEVTPGERRKAAWGVALGFEEWAEI